MKKPAKGMYYPNRDPRSVREKLQKKTLWMWNPPMKKKLEKETLWM